MSEAMAVNGRSVVLKFGGTSVRDAEAMFRVVGIVERERGEQPVVVTSACAGVTDQLLECARLAGAGRRDEALALVAALRDRHMSILATIAPPAHDATASQLVAMLDEIERLVHGVMLLQELTPRTVDAFASFGERLSSVLLHAAFEARGWRAALADSRRFIVTDAEHCNARPLMPEIDRRAATELVPMLAASDVVVAQGFIGSTLDGVTTTIGRGGSDHSGALVGAAIGSREIQIWTDVSGILTADPRIVANARVVPEVTFTEARELAYFGAKVLHPDTIIPALARGIPVVVRNSMKPDDPGTRILPDGAPIAPGIHSVTVKKGMSIVELTDRSGAVGECAVETALPLFRDHGVPLQCALSVESHALAVVESAAMDDVMMTELASRFSVAQQKETAVLALIGSGLRATPDVIAAPLSALAAWPIRFIIAGSSDHVVLVGIDEAYASEALLAVHGRIFDVASQKLKGKASLSQKAKGKS
jgi:aspartate kinase